MKILQINNYGYIKGGSEKVFFETIDTLERNGHQVKAFCMAHQDNRHSENLVEVSVLPYEDRKGFWGNVLSIKNFFYNNVVEKNLVELVEEFNPDIIHVHIIYGRLTNAIIKVANKYKIPIIQSVHEFRLLCPAYTCLDGKLNVCEKCANSAVNYNCVRNKCSKGQLLNSLLVAAECKYRDWFFNHQKKFAGFIMVSKFIQQKHLEYFPSMKDKCYQIYNSVCVEDYKKFVSYEKYKQERYYLYFGRLSYEKGVLTLINFFRNHPDQNLKIIGTGPLQQTIKQLIKEYALANIEVLGYQSGESLFEYVANAYFTIVPSEWYENNPLTIIESLALGTPVIGNKIGGIPEIIIDSETGYVYDYKINDDFTHCMEKTYNLTENHYKRMISRCVEEASDKFDNEKYYDRLIAVYNDVLSKYQ